METVTIHAQTGHDGVLRIDVPVGIADVDCEIVVTVPTSDGRHMTADEWNRFIDQTAGSLATDPLEQLPQGDDEQRDEV